MAVEVVPAAVGVPECSKKPQCVEDCAETIPSSFSVYRPCLVLCLLPLLAPDYPFWSRGRSLVNPAIAPSSSPSACCTAWSAAASARPS